VIMGRVSDGRSPFYPDRRHLHHRLLRAGYSHRRTVLLIYAFTQWLAALALVAANAEMRFLWLGLATAVLVWVVLRSRRYPSRDAQRLTDTPDQQQEPETMPVLQNSSNDRS
ncbi:MAG TPA: undecaprenyl-phosphate alpha-N-acetylglucosaminyl 1-phosphate transferase, partial [Synechococcales bacterium UBA8647]|nr:undecaprenyl-phosphate alpha-N-acetylglucosaminyl 1-phosphate transferase [Synechococcales bacterium UBA8647]